MTASNVLRFPERRPEHLGPFGEPKRTAGEITQDQLDALYAHADALYLEVARLAAIVFQAQDEGIL